MRQKLTPAQDEAMRLYKCNRKDNKDALKVYFNASDTWTEDYKPLREMDFDTFVQALYDGYDVVGPKDIVEQVINAYVSHALTGTTRLALIAKLMEVLQPWLKDTSLTAATDTAHTSQSSDSTE